MSFRPHPWSLDFDFVQGFYKTTRRLTPLVNETATRELTYPHLQNQRRCRKKLLGENFTTGFKLVTTKRYYLKRIVGGIFTVYLIRKVSIVLKYNF